MVCTHDLAPCVIHVCNIGGLCKTGYSGATAIIIGAFGDYRVIGHVCLFVCLSVCLFVCPLIF